MPTRIFTELDAATDAFVVDPAGEVRSGVNGGTVAALSTILIQTGVGSFEMNPNLNGTSPDGTAQCTIVSIADALTQEWTIDYTIFPAIPENAKVKKLVFRRPRSVNYTIDGTFPTANIASFALYSDAILTPVYFTPVNAADFASPTLVVESITGAAADIVLFDHTGGDTYITRQELIDNWSSFNNNIFQIGIDAQGDDSPNPAVASLVGSLSVGSGWTVTVTYEEGLLYHLSQNASPVDEGSVITVTSPDEATALAMEDIESVKVTFPDPNNPGTTITINVPIWTVVTNNLLTFVMPNLSGFEPIVINVVVTSTQFVGDLNLGYVYTVFLINAPGIYKLVPGQRFDRLYDRTDPADISTVDIKIKDPFIKTGPVNG